jgi:hypothetical protein
MCEREIREEQMQLYAVLGIMQTIEGQKKRGIENWGREAAERERAELNQSP